MRPRSPRFDYTKGKVDLRYQNLPWWGKLGRQLRHTPVWWLKFQWYRVKYLLGFVEEDAIPPKIARSIFLGCRDAAMKHYYTVEEVLHHIRSKAAR